MNKLYYLYRNKFKTKIMARGIKPDVQIKLQPMEYIKRTQETEHHFKGIPKKYKVKTIENSEVNYYKSGLEV